MSEWVQKTPELTMLGATPLASVSPSGKARAASMIPHPGPAALHTPQPVRRIPASGDKLRMINTLTGVLEFELLEEPLLRLPFHLSFDFNVILDPAPLELVSE